jgi:hypothetical protein
MSHPHHTNGLSRRNFIKLGGAALGRVVLTACKRGNGPVVELTAVPTPANAAAATQAAPAQAVPSLAAGEFADTLLVNGNILSMDAKRSAVKALAIRNGIILATGDDQSIRAKAGSPEQALTIKETRYAHTMGGAYADFAENKKGSLEPGKFADLAVWHDNPYSLKPTDLLNVTIDLTMVGGKLVYQA